MADGSVEAAITSGLTASKSQRAFDASRDIGDACSHLSDGDFDVISTAFSFCANLKSTFTRHICGAIHPHARTTLAF